MIKSIANISNQEATNKLLQDCICKKIKQKRCAELLGLSVRVTARDNLFNLFHANQGETVA